MLLQHPGGEDIILEHTGGDGTIPFLDVHHSPVAIEMLEKFLIGEITEVLSSFPYVACILSCWPLILRDIHPTHIGLT